MSKMSTVGSQNFRFYAYLLVSITMVNLAHAQTKVPNVEKCSYEVRGAHEDTHLELINRIKSLEKEMVELVGSQRKTLTQPICRMASSFMAKLLLLRLGILAEPISSRFHTFLKIPSFYPDGSPLYIDPSYQQFVVRWGQPGLDGEPLIFVGNRLEFEGVLQRLTDPKRTSGYFDVTPDYQILESEYFKK